MNLNASNQLSLLALSRSLFKNYSLIKQLTKREVVGRYRGSLLGIGWSFLNPLLMLLVFTFIFSVVFKAKWGLQLNGQEEGEFVFAVVLFIGLILHSILAETITRSPATILVNTNYVKKVVFPLEILPIVVVLSAFFHSLVSLLIWFIFFVIVVGLPPIEALLFPLVLMPLIILCVGLSYVLSAIGVFIRDITQFTGVLATVLLFMSPVFFPIERLPEAYQSLFMVNPLTFIVEQSRDVLIWGKTPNYSSLTIYTLIALSILVIGFYIFQKARKGFADVL